MRQRPNRWVKWTVLLAIPVILALVLREQRSWRPIRMQSDRELHDLRVSPDGRFLAGIRGPLEPHFGYEIRSLPWGEQIYRNYRVTVDHLEFSPDSRKLLQYDTVGNLRCQDLSNLEFNTLSRAGDRFAAPFQAGFWGDGNHIAVVRNDFGNRLPWLVLPGLISIVNLSTGVVERTMRLGGTANLDKRQRYIQQLVWAPNDRSLLAFVGVGAPLDDRTGGYGDISAMELWRWDNEGKVIRTVGNLPFSGSEPTIDPGGDKFAVFDPGASNGAPLATWNLSGRLLFETSVKWDGEGYSSITPLQFTPDRQWMAYSRGHLIRIHDAKDGRLLREVRHGASAVSVTFTPDGRTMITSCDDGSLLSWRIR